MENTVQIQYVHEYVSDRTTFETLKATQIAIAAAVRANTHLFKQAQRDGQNPYKIVYEPHPDARLHNVAYALVRGKRYAQIEPKLCPGREGRQATRPITKAQLERYFSMYPGVDQSKVNWEGLK